MGDGWKEMFAHLSPWGALKNPGPAGVQVGGNVPAEGEKAKKEASTEEMKPPTLPFCLGQALTALELSIQICVKELHHYT